MMLNISIQFRLYNAQKERKKSKTTKQIQQNRKQTTTKKQKQHIDTKK